MHEVAAYFVGSIGIIITLLVNLDCLATTLSVSTDGALSHIIMIIVQGIAHLVRPKCCHFGHRVLMTLGGITLFGTILSWFVGLWIGWSMIFHMTNAAVYTGTPPDIQSATTIERIYFAGMCISTLGMGDVLPKPGIFQFLSAVAGMNGFFLVGIAASYVFQVVSAVAQNRDLATLIGSIGGTPQDILLTSYNGDDFSELSSFLQTLIPMIISAAHRTLLFPIQNTYYTARSRHNDSIRVAALFETLLILRYGSAPEACIDNTTLTSAEKAIAFFALAKKKKWKVWRKDSRAPKLIQKQIYNSMIDKGLPLKPYDDFVKAVEAQNQAQKVRCLLYRFVTRHRYNWSQVYKGQENPMVHHVDPNSQP
jgi:hypothetical protein